jgi:hypothetical protein
VEKNKKRKAKDEKELNFVLVAILMAAHCCY